MTEEFLDKLYPSMYWQYCCSDCPAHLEHSGWATWAIWEAIKKYNHFFKNFTVCVPNSNEIKLSPFRYIVLVSISRNQSYLFDTPQFLTIHHNSQFYRFHIPNTCNTNPSEPLLPDVCPVLGVYLVSTSKGPTIALAGQLVQDEVKTNGIITSQCFLDVCIT